MIIENLNGLIVLHAEGTNKITNSERSFFSDFIYLGKNDSIDNYQEVTKDVWKHYIGQLNQNDADIINIKIEETNSNILNLEEVSLDTDFRLMMLEIKLEFGETARAVSLFSYTNLNTIGGNNVYTLLKKRIERQSYESKEEMQTMLDLYYFKGRITAEQYDELSNLLESQED